MGFYQNSDALILDMILFFILIFISIFIPYVEYEVITTQFVNPTVKVIFVVIWAEDVLGLT